MWPPLLIDPTPRPPHLPAANLKKLAKAGWVSYPEESRSGWVLKQPAQLVIAVSQVYWCHGVEDTLRSPDPHQSLGDYRTVRVCVPVRVCVCVKKRNESPPRRRRSYLPIPTELRVAVVTRVCVCVCVCVCVYVCVRVWVWVSVGVGGTPACPGRRLLVVEHYWHVHAAAMPTYTGLSAAPLSSPPASHSP